MPGRWRLAASIAAFALIAGVVGYFGLDHEPGVSTYTTALGEQREVKLADGSLIRMNTSSQLRVAFNEQKREIRLLDGEALFVVARDVQRPFWVVTDKARIRAVGTEFNVYRSHDVTRVSVLEGIVQIAADGSSAAVLPRVVAGEQAVARDNTVVKVAAANVDRSVAWRRRELVFQQAPLAEVAAEFNRYNRQKLHVVGTQVEHRMISGIFSADYPQSLILFLRKDASLAVQETKDAWVVRERAPFKAHAD
jgi:transmembrane sensor